jgi:hypothetical protein
MKGFEDMRNALNEMIFGGNDEKQQARLRAQSHG